MDHQLWHPSCSGPAQTQKSDLSNSVGQSKRYQIESEVPPNGPTGEQQGCGLVIIVMTIPRKRTGGPQHPSHYLMQLLQAATIRLTFLCALPAVYIQGVARSIFQSHKQLFQATKPKKVYYT